MDPSSGNSNGYYGGKQESENQTKKSSSGEDFEEYMWMANEEEAEKEMMRQIQEEKLAEQLYRETVDEATLRLQQHQLQVGTSWPETGQQWSSGTAPQSAPPPSQNWTPRATANAPEATALADNLRTMTVNDKPKVALNPMAAEFVPGRPLQPSFQPTSG